MLNYMKNNNLIIGVGVVILVVVAYFLGTKNNTTQTEVSGSVVSNTTDSTSTSTAVIKNTNVKPVVKTTTTTTSSNYIKIDQRVLLSGVYVTPSKVTYDSRCAKDVQCIQAGTVELGVLLESGSLSQSVIITLGKPFYFAERQVTLTSVTPSKLSTKVLKDSDYRFSITVK